MLSSIVDLAASAPDYPEYDVFDLLRMMLEALKSTMKARIIFSAFKKSDFWPVNVEAFTKKPRPLSADVDVSIDAVRFKDLFN